MEHEFLNRFYSTKCIISVIKLTNTKQWEDEPVLDYINRWRSLSLECKGHFTKASAIEMCAQGVEWDLLDVLQMSKPRNFQELATKVHPMEMNIANCRNKSSSSYEFKKNKHATKKSSKPSKASTKESMATSVKEPVRISGKSRLKEKKGSSSRDEGRKRPTLKKLKEKKYPFPDSDLSGMLDDLLKNTIIELPTPKQPKKVGRTTDSKY